jgi:hypothetical protein
VQRRRSVPVHKLDPKRKRLQRRTDVKGQKPKTEARLTVSANATTNDLVIPEVHKDSSYGKEATWIDKRADGGERQGAADSDARNCQGNVMPKSVRVSNNNVKHRRSAPPSNFFSLALVLMLSTGRRQSFAPGGDFEDGTSAAATSSTEPSEELLDSFWQRIAQLTTRTSVDNVWVGSEELLHWNRANLIVSTF